MRVICLLFILWSSLVHGDSAETPNLPNVIVVPSSEVHQGDYFAVGKSVEISGTIRGDLYVLAGQVVIDGVVDGDVLGSAGSLDISGHVAHNCRLLAGQVLLAGTVGNNVSIVAGNVQMLPSCTVGGNLTVAAGNLDLAARIGGDATVAVSNLRLSSRIQGDLMGYMGQMRMTSRTSIGGNVDYRSNTEAWIEPGAQITGQVVHHPSFVHGLLKDTWIHRVIVGSAILVTLMNVLYTVVVGIIFLKLFPSNLHAALDVLKTRPFKAAGYGVLFLLLLPLASLILLMTVLGVPFALALIAANILGFYTAKVYTIFWASNWMFVRMGFKESRLPSYLLGTLLYFLLTTIPFVGTALGIAAMLLGLGAGILAQMRRGVFGRSL